LAIPLQHTVSQKAKPFLGWKMVLVAFCIDFVAVGFFFYSYGVFFKAIAADFGGSRLEPCLNPLQSRRY
jgi:hypothetical protein